MVENLSAEFRDQQDGKRIQHVLTKTDSKDLAKPDTQRFRQKTVELADELASSGRKEKDEGEKGTESVCNDTRARIGWRY
jgi:hypothetical protein